MRAIFIPFTHQQKWCAEYFPRHSLCSLPLAGKPTAEYYLDLCQELHISKARILDAAYQRPLAHYLALRKNNFVPFSYHGEQMPQSLSSLMRHHSSFTSSDDCLVFYGAVLPRLKSAEDFFPQFETVPQAEGEGIYRLHPGGQTEKYTGPLYHVNSLKDYFELNFTFLDESFYVIPGYRENNGLTAGINVILSPDSRMADRILIGDRSKINPGCVFRNGVIIGDGTLITENNTLDHALIFDHTYIPRNLWLNHKIVTANRIIDPYTGGQIKRSRMSGLCMNFSTLHRLGIQWLKKNFALILFILLLPIALLLRLCARGYRRKYHSRSLLLLCRHSALLQILQGKRQLIHSYSQHYPPKAVFSLAGCYGPSYTFFQRRLYGQYFTRHPSCRLILLIVWKNLLTGLQRRD